MKSFNSKVFYLLVTATTTNPPTCTLTHIPFTQTGSGKTWTMGTSASLVMYEEEKGVVPRVMVDLYDRITKSTAANPGGNYI